MFVLHKFRLSQTSVPSVKLTLQPKYLRILTDPLTSDKSGQLCNMLSSPLSSVAARIGKAEFFEPWTAVSPRSLFIPSITRRDKYNTLF